MFFILQITVAPADPKNRITLRGVAEHPWVISDDGPIPEYLCMCKRKIIQRQESSEHGKDADVTS